MNEERIFVEDKITFFNKYVDKDSQVAGENEITLIGTAAAFTFAEKNQFK